MHKQDMQSLLRRMNFQSQLRLNEQSLLLLVVNFHRLKSIPKQFQRPETASQPKQAWLLQNILRVILAVMQH